MSETVPAPQADRPPGLLSRLGLLFRTYALPQGSLVVPSQFERDDRNCFIFHVPAEWESDSGGVSRIRLLEDGEHLGPKGVTHDDVRTLGRGRYSHWGTKVYFSTSDNSDPNVNGRTYSVVPPPDWTPDEGASPWEVRPVLARKGQELAVEWTAEDVSPVRIQPAGGRAWRFELSESWPGDEEGLSTLILLEDGRPLPRPHVEPQVVEVDGAGAYTHRGRQVLFSTSDGSDPRKNGRRMSYAHAQAFVFSHALCPPRASDGHSWILDGMPRAWPSDTQGASLVRLLEDGRLLGPHGAGHDVIRKQGAGAYSHWGDQLWFSTSDNSDPTTNGRTYTVLWLGPAGS